MGTLRVGDSSLQMFKYGAGEVRLSGALRADGIVRGLGGLYAGQFTTTQRDAIPAGFRPYGLVIFNTTSSRLEVNLGTDATPSWSTNLAGGIVTILDEGSVMPPRTRLNFVGAGVTVTDDSANAQLTITVPGATSGGGGSTDLPPPGTIVAFAGASPPNGWYLCDGSSKTTGAPNIALFNAISYTYGGSGSSFNIPDIQGRMVVGKGAHLHHNALNKNDGLPNASRAASHYHTYDRPINPAHIGPSGSDPSDVSSGAKTSGDVNNADRPAFITLNWMIRYL